MRHDELASIVSKVFAAAISAAPTKATVAVVVLEASGEYGVGSTMTRYDLADVMREWLATHETD